MKPRGAVVLGAVIAACGSDDPATPSSSSGGGATTIDGIPARDPSAFNAWLQKKEYASWPKESVAHASTGPHANSVRAHLSPKLDQSMAAGNTEHPKGSAAVKEFLSNGQVAGWAAYVKTEDQSSGGSGWYWYEIFSVDPGGSAIEGQGKSTCTGCHSGGKDFVLSSHPLK